MAKFLEKPIQQALSHTRPVPPHQIQHQTTLLLPSHHLAWILLLSLDFLPLVFRTVEVRICHKLSELQSFIYSSYDIFAATETWLSDFILDNEILPSGYALFCKDRSSRGGGVLLAVNNSIPCQLLEIPSNLEQLSACLCLITVCVLHNPPNASTNYHQGIIDYLSTIISDSPVFIMGISILQISIGQLCPVHLLSPMICVILSSNTIFLKSSTLPLISVATYWI